MANDVTTRPNEAHVRPFGARAASPYGAFRDLIGYDPFSRFFSTLDPAIEVFRTDEGYDVEIPVAGFKPGEIDITVKEDVLTVSGKTERRAFTRALQLPDDIDQSTIEAKVEDGMLSLKLKRRPETQPRKIEIKHN
jgi:HSP20 family molecular chaperone IbpA